MSILLISLLLGGIIIPLKKNHSYFQTVWAKEGNGIEPQSSSLEERLVLNHVSLQLIGEKPLWGWGPGNWKIVAPFYGLVGYYEGWGTRYYLEAHNDWLKIVSERGFFGLLGCCLLIISLFKSVLSLGPSLKTHFIIGCFLGIGISFTGIFGFSQPEIMGSLLFLMALVFREGIQGKTFTPVPPAFAFSFPIIMVVVITFGFFRSHSSSLPDLRAPFAQWAPFTLPIRTLHPENLIPLTLFDIQPGMSTSQRRSMIQNSLRINPFHPFVWRSALDYLKEIGNAALFKPVQENYLEHWPTDPFPPKMLMLEPPGYHK